MHDDNNNFEAKVHVYLNVKLVRYTCHFIRCSTIAISNFESLRTKTKYEEAFHVLQYAHETDNYLF